MKQIATFFTLYWCIYFPTCIAYNDLPGFSSVDEVMTGILVIYTFIKKGQRSLNREPWKEFYYFWGILFFFTVYGLLFSRNVAGGVWLDFIQELRPYSIIYCTWILNPRFSKGQKKLMLGTMLIVLVSWLFYHPIQEDSEFPVLGQLAICTGMSWYLLTKDKQKNKYIALVIVLIGMLAPKFKFMGEVVCFIYMFFFLKKKMNFASPKTILTILILISIILYVAWERFDIYYVTGMVQEEKLARPETYKTAVKILWDYFPFGSGMGSFACNGAWKYFSPIYAEYDMLHIWGIGGGGGFIADAYYPTLAQFGVVGVYFFYVFWKRRLKAFNNIEDLKYYRVAMMTFCCLAIEQTSDSSWLSGKGMGYCMLLALCLNANRNLGDKNVKDNDVLEDCDERLEDDIIRETSPGSEGIGLQLRDDYWVYHKRMPKR